MPMNESCPECGYQVCRCDDLYDDSDEIEDDVMHCPDCGGELDGECGCTDSECGWTYEEDEDVELDRASL